MEAEQPVAIVHAFNHSSGDVRECDSWPYRTAHTSGFSRRRRRLK
jgi:hypothetical protein